MIFVMLAPAELLRSGPLHEDAFAAPRQLTDFVG
jgi:hypothetical protein